ncbi:hypothetical protein BS333_21395 (plasmid) [Vibrio azureus]|uniref:Conjugal transfer protein n=1 Tax=Vibrio azureus NBRC 104587 TaxID=1219077 RepID=U3CCY3_9VIBR|nr:RAQPRD family integrative conjugative element protein [Vibrio azureus]AUI88938.1 hypothetical protein BS333_21395 [Vibrio azureus]GAD76203.1 hypothetical protein VAZ01S_039_00280 [Vibrio azureus NBRC 104587]
MKWPLYLGLSLSLLTPPLLADVDSERKELNLIIRQLDTLDYLISRAEREADYRSPRQFNYDAFRSDIRTLQAGIDAYLRPHRASPRPITPLGGDYLGTAEVVSE